MIKALLFDLDGTFADTAPDLAAALNHLRRLHRLEPLPLKTIRPQASHGSPGLLKLGMSVSSGDPGFSELQARFLDYYAAHICEHTVLFPGMAELISALEKKGLPWGIVTNKPHRFTLPLVQALGYASRAACLVSGDTCEFAKPHPEPLLFAARQIGVEPAACLYLGDDKRDMDAANAAGMLGVIAQYGYVEDAVDFSGWHAAGRISECGELVRFLAPGERGA